MIICPKCGNQDCREMRICPQMDGKPVCARCCTECAYYDLGGFYPCRYHIENPRPDYRGEIYKLKRKIDQKIGMIDYYYTRSKPHVAQRMEGELSLLRRDLKELEEKYAEAEKAGYGK